jgi:hippurate hydrolase
MVLFSTLPVGAQTGIAPDALKTQIDRQIPELTTMYRQLHQHPELSHHEENTSAYLAGELRKSGYEVTEHVGKYPDGSQAWGIVGVLKNGVGPAVLIRTDMDALPVTEATGLDYASHVRSQNAEKQDVGVMHACGHDIHMTALLGVAHALVANKDKWHGTVVLVGQPSEETGDGARAMLADGFFDRFPKPDYILAQHDTNDYATGHVAISPGPVLASATSVNVVFHGIGAHGSKPSSGKDPIVMGAEFVMLVQTVVSRQISALEPAVLTVGTFHAGTKNNIIPDDAVLGLTLRAYSEDVRQKLLDGVKRTANGVATAYAVVLDRMPEVTVFESTVPTINDLSLTERVRKAAEQALGAANVDAAKPVMGSEDVDYFSLDGKIPFVFFWLGAADPQKLATSKATGTPLPNIHSALFAPVYEPTIRTGVLAMTAAALALLQR